MNTGALFLLSFSYSEITSTLSLCIPYDIHCNHAYPIDHFAMAGEYHAMIPLLYLVHS